jgi:SAM-dependent methyltransferase
MYVEQQYIADLDGCDFYHAMDLPGVGEVNGRWDLRPTIDTYLGNVSFVGKRVLDVGAASGYLTFEMERRGGDVVSFDMAGVNDWEIVPFANPDYDIDAVRDTYEKWVKGAKAAYWFAHRLLKSRAKAYYGDIYRLPESLGRFDVAMLGMIVGHIRDPFGALVSITRLVDDLIVWTESAPAIEEPYACFMPDPDRLQPDAAWWATSESCRTRMLGVLGFELVRREQAVHRRCDVGHLCSTQVFRRQSPLRAV